MNFQAKNKHSEPEVIEENEEYTKKYFPYTVQSDVNRLGRFFYWLENSNQLVTFKGSPLDIQLLDSQGVLGQITVKMKVGAYFNEVKTVEEKPVEVIQSTTPVVKKPITLSGAWRSFPTPKVLT